MKNLFKHILLISILFSCSQKDKTDYRKPFKINRNIDCQLLIDKGYTRIYGEDVILIGKRTNDTLVYYQIEYPINEQDLMIYDIEDEIHPIDSISTTKEIENLCEDGVIYWRNFELKLDSINACNYKNTIDKTKYKIIESSYESIEPLYFRDTYQVVNLMSKDTFDCSVINRDKNWFIQSSILIQKK